MAMNRFTSLGDESISSDAGMHRFRWDMRHTGAWHADEDRRFRNGPLAKPGIYTVRLTVGDDVMETSFELMTDPRVLAQGTTNADIGAQVDMQLGIVAMLTEARQLQQSLSDTRDELDKKGDARSEADSARLERVTSLLGELKDADYAYPQPMLVNQIDYLLEMLSTADQAPGRDADERFEELRGQLAALVERAAAGD
jgi:hypothetical protein